MPLRASLRQIASGEVENQIDQKAITTVYREDLSFNASMKNMPQSRYCEVVTYRVLPGHDAEVAEAAKMVRAAYEKANIPMEWATYQVFAGAPAGTYYVFRAVDSLARLDPTNMQMMQAVNTALGEEGGKRLMELVSKGQISRELNIYAFNPQTSYAPPEFAEADSFWAPQPSPMATAGTSGKSTGEDGGHRQAGEEAVDAEWAFPPGRPRSSRRGASSRGPVASALSRSAEGPPHQPAPARSLLQAVT